MWDGFLELLTLFLRVHWSRGVVFKSLHNEQLFLSDAQIELEFRSLRFLWRKEKVLKRKTLKKALEPRGKATTNLSHVRRQVRESNLCHNSRMRALIQSATHARQTLRNTLCNAVGTIMCKLTSAPYFHASFFFCHTQYTLTICFWNNLSWFYQPCSKTFFLPPANLALQESCKEQCFRNSVS